MTYLDVIRDRISAIERNEKHLKVKARKLKLFNGRKYKEFISSISRNAHKLTEETLLGTVDTPCKGTEADSSNQVDQESQSPSVPSIRIMVDTDCGSGWISPDLCCSPPLLTERKVVDCPISKDNQDMDESPCDLECTNSQPDSSQIPTQYTECTICSRSGKLLCCDGKGCSRTFHLSCVDPPLSCFPPGVWHCNWCIEKFIKNGVHSISDGIESILDSKDVVVSHDEVMQNQMQMQYLVKYKNVAHVHSRWIPQAELLHEAPYLLARFKKSKMIANSDWSVPQRLIQKRLLVYPEPCNDLKGHDGNYPDCRYMWLVKWTGLCYGSATWELENSSFLKTPEAIKLINDYETRHQNSQSPKEIERTNCSSLELTELPLGKWNTKFDSHLSYVNILRGYMHRGENAVVFDKERIVKVVLFVLSVLDGDNTKQPFLIITPQDSISFWETEFSNWASSSSSDNIVVYSGNKDVRTTIRHLEFYNATGSMMFQIILSPSHVVVEDLQILEVINWGAVIVDECQRRQTYAHFKKFKQLAANMRLLLFSWEAKRRFSYHDALSLLDPKFDGIDEDSIESDLKLDVSDLKQRFLKFVAFEIKAETLELAEYWVPVHLSDVQVEQYCTSFLSNSTSLCCSLRNDSVDSLRKILLLNRMCCDHPYLVDKYLQVSLERDLDAIHHLDIGINASGKLRLLEKILIEINSRGLRVLILFQSLSCSGSISIGDILDDIVRVKFGENSYVRVDGGVKRSIKKAALRKFNNIDNGHFICLIDNRACFTHITLSSVNLVVIFDSDLNPINDLQALQKISIDPQLQPLKVFRLYSPLTLEEKALILAKQGRNLDNSMANISWSTCQQLLKWDACRLFSRLDDSTGFEDTLFNNVLDEFSNLLPNAGNDGDSFNCLFISSAKEKDNIYCTSASVIGENIEDRTRDNFLANEPAPVFWANLLEGREPICRISQRNRKKVKNLSEVLQSSQPEKASSENRRRKTHNFDLVSPSPPRRQRGVRRVRRRIAERDPAEIMRCYGFATNTIQVKPPKEILSTDQLQILETQIAQAMRTLLLSDQMSICSNSNALEPSALASECLDPIINEAQKDLEEAMRIHKEMRLKLILKRDTELAAINKKYNELLQEVDSAFIPKKNVYEKIYKTSECGKYLADAMATDEEELSKFMEEVVQQYINKISGKDKKEEIIHIGRPKRACPMSLQLVRRNECLEMMGVGTGPYIKEQSVVARPTALALFRSSGTSVSRAGPPHLRHIRPPPQSSINPYIYYR